MTNHYGQAFQRPENYRPCDLGARSAMDKLSRDPRGMVFVYAAESSHGLKAPE